MKKNQVNEILINQTKRRDVVFSFVCSIVIVTFIAISFFLIYFNQSKTKYVNYKEQSNIDYNVFLKENEFFENDFLVKDKEYIAGLIDYITANFEYELSLDEKNVEYKYYYRIEADVDVVRKNGGRSLYSTTRTLLDEVEKNTSDVNVKIKENIIINYNEYNDLIKRFTTTYSLDDIESTLTINMYINVIGICEEFEENTSKESVMSLSIPLTTKTVGIDLSNNLINSDNNVMKCEKSSNFSIVFAVLGILFVITDIVLIVFTIKYEIKTRTAENIYERELKKILNNYSSYIQKMNNDFDFKSYELLKIDTFTDMLEIRDTIRQPILMKENSRKTGAYFVIPSSSKILYVYRIKISDIKKEILEKSKK